MCESKVKSVKYHNKDKKGVIIIMSTIVTAFVSGANTNRGLETYMEHGKRLLEIEGVRKIVFIEEKIWSTYLQNIDFPMTTFRFIEKEALYTFKLSCPNFHLATDNPAKDTLEYMCIMAQKSEWIKEAIEMDETSAINVNYIWIDFGIYHIIKGGDTSFTEMIQKACNSVYKDRIRIAGGNTGITIDFYRIQWFFLGGIFGGPAHILIAFADAMRQKVEEMVETTGHLCWEINLWISIYQEHPEWFDRYVADHNASMIEMYYTDRKEK